MDIPAFPNNFIGAKHQGMTLRDYFAAKAMHAMYAASFEWEPTGAPRDDKHNRVMKELALDAYGIADAMMEARNVAQ